MRARHDPMAAHFVEEFLEYFYIRQSMQSYGQLRVSRHRFKAYLYVRDEWYIHDKSKLVTHA
jgi:hypothetical protein